MERVNTLILLLILIKNALSVYVRPHALSHLWLSPWSAALPARVTLSLCSLLPILVLLPGNREVEVGLELRLPFSQPSSPSLSPSLAAPLAPVSLRLSSACPVTLHTATPEVSSTILGRTPF